MIVAIKTGILISTWGRLTDDMREYGKTNEILIGTNSLCYNQLRIVEISSIKFIVWKKLFE